jgi:hypothetical protein
MVPTFAKVVHIMKDLWIKEIGDDEKSQIDIMPYLSKATLDVIGLVGNAKHLSMFFFFGLD